MTVIAMIVGGIALAVVILALYYIMATGGGPPSDKPHDPGVGGSI